MACPFMLPRTLARRFGTATLAWPPWLRNKWPAVFLVVVFLWAYEAFALWDSPWLTAAIVLAFFAAGLPDRRSLSRRIVLQVCLPDRPVQFRAIARLAAGDQGARAGRLLVVPHPRIASAAATTSPAASSASTSRGSRATWIARSAWIVFTRARTRTSASSQACPAPSSGTTRAVPASAGSAGASTWPRLCVVLVSGAFANAALMTGPLSDLAEIASWPHPGSDSPFLATTALCLLALVVLPLFVGGGHGGALAPLGSFARKPRSRSRRDLPMRSFRWVSGCGWLTTVSTS